MKKNLSFFIVFALGIVSFGQPTIKVFGFEQEILPGTIAVNVKDENGNTVKKEAAKKNYFIYLSFKKAYSITPRQVFINGKAFTTETKQVKKTPVEYLNINALKDSKKMVLVPPTSNKVIELKIKKPVNVKKSAWLEDLTHKYDIVISYVWKKKKYYVVLKDLNKIDPLINE